MVCRSGRAGVGVGNGKGSLMRTHVGTLWHGCCWLLCYRSKIWIIDIIHSIIIQLTFNKAIVCVKWDELFFL